MKTYKELKDFCDEKIKEFPQYLKKYKKEIRVAERFYTNGRNLYSELFEKKPDNRYIIPFLLGITLNVDESKEPEYIQVKAGASGGIDMPLYIGICK